jgi:hypothetical protein
MRLGETGNRGILKENWGEISGITAFKKRV